MAKDSEDEEEDSNEDETEEEEEKPSRKKKQKVTASVSLYEPMFVWIALLLIAVVLKVVLTSTVLDSAGPEVYMLSSVYSNFILEFPGTIILPLIIGAIIGSEVGKKSTTLKNATKSGVLNGVYAAVIYLITIIVIYMIINYTTPQYALTFAIVMQNMVAPIIVFLITLEVFAVLSHLRRVE